MLLVQKHARSFSPIKTPPATPQRPASAAPDFFGTLPNQVFDTAYARERSRSAHNFSPITTSSSSSSLSSAPLLDLFAEIMVSKSQEREDASAASSTDESELDEALPSPSPRRPLAVPKALLDDSDIQLTKEKTMITDTLPHSSPATLSVGVVVEHYVDLEVVQWMQPLRKTPTGFWNKVSDFTRREIVDRKMSRARFLPVCTTAQLSETEARGEA